MNRKARASGRSEDSMLLDDRKPRSKTASRSGSTSASRSASRSPAPVARRKSIADMSPAPSSAKKTSANASTAATPVKGRAARATPKKSPKAPREEEARDDSGSELEQEDTFDTEEIVSARRQKQAAIMKEQQDERMRQEREEANGLLAVGHINHGHAMMIGTILIAVAYVIASTAFQTDVLTMPVTTKLKKGYISTDGPAKAPANGQPASAFGVPAAAPNTAGSPFGTASSFGAGPLFEFDFVQQPLSQSVWRISESNPGAPYKCPFSSRAVLSNAGQPLMLGSFAEQFGCFSGEIRTQQTFSGGCFKTTFKPAKVSGVVAEYLLQSMSNGRSEISLQFRGLDSTTLHVMLWSRGQIAATQSVSLGFDASQTEHTYAIFRSTQGLAVIVDGNTVWQTSQGPESHLAMEAIVNTWAVDASGEQVVGQFTGQQAAVTYVKSILVTNSC